LDFLHWIPSGEKLHTEKLCRRNQTAIVGLRLLWANEPIFAVETAERHFSPREIVQQGVPAGRL
jgi:hypothetical protein